MLKRGFQFAPGYRLQEFLGRGQFGQVWRATAPGGAAAAVKFIDLSDGQGQKEYDGVKRVKQIRHANLMPITAIWLLDGEGKVIEEAPDEAIETIDFSVAEPRGVSAVIKKEVVEPSWLAVSMLLGGKSLQARLRECVDEGFSGIPPKELISYMDESAKGIDFLNAPQHDLGEGPIAIQHSDVKPANIVLIGSSAVVCDFGLARILTRNQVTATSAAGTPAYMAPEAISGKPCRTSDQYSLAVTYYHLRTGALPVNDGSLWEVLDAHRQGKLKLGLVPEAEQEVLRKATDLNWEERFETNVEMVDALREALRSEGHTKPSFVPKSTTIPANDETVNLANDPTATLDTAALTPPGSATDSADKEAKDEANVETQPFVQAEHPTGENFLDETLPQLNEKKRDETQSASILENLKQQPMVLAGVGGAVVLMIALGIFFSLGDTGEGNTSEATTTGQSGTEGQTGDQSGTSGQTGTGQSETGQDADVDSAKLFAEALKTFGSDEAGAIARYNKAAKADPKLGFIDSEALSGHQSSVFFLRITPDGKRLVSAADAPFLWNWRGNDPKPIALGTDGELIEVVELSAKGDRLLTAGPPLVWNLDASDVAGSASELKGHVDVVIAAAWHPSESIVVTASSDPSIGVWKLGAADSDNPNGTVTKAIFPLTETIRTNELTIDPQGQWLAAVSDPLSGTPSAMVFAWKEVEGTLAKTFAPAPIQVTTGLSARTIEFLRPRDDNAILAVGDEAGSISLYSLGETPKLVDRHQAHDSFVEAMAVVRTDNSDVIASGSSDGTVSWWRIGATSEKRSLRVGSLPISSIALSADGRWIAAGCYDQSVWLWDTSVSQPAAVTQLPAGSRVHSVRFDPTGQKLAAGCDDGTVRTWDLVLAKLIAITSPTPIVDSTGPTTTLETTPRTEL